MFSPKNKASSKVAVARTPSLADVDVDSSVLNAKQKVSLVEASLEAMDAFSYAMPVRQQSSGWGGVLTIAAMGLMTAVSLVNLQDFYFGESCVVIERRSGNTNTNFHLQPLLRH